LSFNEIRRAHGHFHFCDLFGLYCTYFQLCSWLTKVYPHNLRDTD